MANSTCSFCANQPPSLLAGSCPNWLAELAQERQRLQNFQQNRLDVLEFFSGHGNLHRACQNAGLDAIGFDHLNGPGEDLHYLRGLETAIDRVLEVRQHGLVWFAPPCSWWTFLASPNHKRSLENRYEGDSSNLDVRLANSLAHVVAALMRLCASLGLAVVIEQPSDSCLFSFGCLKKSLAVINACSVQTYLSAFSSAMPIPKPLVLKGTCRWLGSLFRNKPSRSFEQGRAYAKTPDGKVCGLAELQATQQYPLAFGEAARDSEDVVCFPS